MGAWSDGMAAPAVVFGTSCPTRRTLAAPGRKRGLSGAVFFWGGGEPGLGGMQDGMRDGGPSTGTRQAPCAPPAGIDREDGPLFTRPPWRKRRTALHGCTGDTGSRGRRPATSLAPLPPLPTTRSCCGAARPARRASSAAGVCPCSSCAMCPCVARPWMTPAPGLMTVTPAGRPSSFAAWSLQLQDGCMALCHVLAPPA